MVFLQFIHRMLTDEHASHDHEPHVQPKQVDAAAVYGVVCDRLRKLIHVEASPCAAMLHSQRPRLSDVLELFSQILSTQLSMQGLSSALASALVLGITRTTMLWTAVAML